VAALVAAAEAVTRRRASEERARDAARHRGERRRERGRDVRREAAREVNEVRRIRDRERERRGRHADVDEIALDARRVRASRVRIVARERNRLAAVDHLERPAARIPAREAMRIALRLAADRAERGLAPIDERNVRRIAREARPEVDHRRNERLHVGDRVVAVGRAKAEVGDVELGAVAAGGGEVGEGEGGGGSGGAVEEGAAGEGSHDLLGELAMRVPILLGETPRDA
jgi:hypothetical protein